MNENYSDLYGYIELYCSKEKETDKINVKSELTDYINRNKDNQELLENFIKEEPNNINKLTDIEKANLVSSIDYLYRRINKNIIPKWIKSNKFVLKDPYFAMNAKSNLKLVLLKESPIEFKMRNMYVSKNTLSRV